MVSQYKGILHASFIVDNLERSLAFYHGVLGIEIDPSRPEMNYPGAWLTVGGDQIHLLQLPNPDPVTGRPQHGGRDRHVAIAVDDLDELASKLNRHGIVFSMSKSGRKAMFVRDPDGNALEFIQTG